MTPSADPDARSRMLFLSTRFPFPLDTGGKIRTANILEQLHARFRLTVLSYVDPARDGPHLHCIHRVCERFIAVPWREPIKYTARYYWKILTRCARRWPVTVLNDYSKAMRSAIRGELASGPYDLLLCDFVQAAANIPEPWRVPVAIFQHNVEATILERHHRTASHPLLKALWGSQHRKMAAFEGEMLRRAQGIIAVSDLDRDRMAQSYGAENVDSIPTGVDTEFFAPRPDVDEKERLVFVGSMDWEPNDDAMTWHIESIHERIRARRPNVELVIVGRNPSPRLEALAKRTAGVRLTGRVDDTRPHIAESAVFIVPIRIGGGTRMKIYEALGMAKAVVTTTVGAEGLPLEGGRHVLFADDEAGFADAVVRLLEDAALRRSLGAAGRDYVVEHFGWARVGEIFAGLCDATIERSRRETARS